MRAITSHEGVDVVYDPVGGAIAEPALRSLAWGGRFLVIGFAAGEIPKVALNLVLLKEASIVGVYWGMWAVRAPETHRAAAERIFDWIATGKLRPHVSEALPFERAQEALEKLERREVKGKIVLVP